MDNKYYTPELSEFYIGFQYEQKVGNPQNDLIEEIEFNYNKCKFPDPFLGYNLNKLNLSNIRVKYLDKKDVENCGWIWNTDRYEHNNNDWGADLEILDNNEGVAINQIVYSIKNINELQKLMKQLNIS